MYCILDIIMNMPTRPLAFCSLASLADVGAAAALVAPRSAASNKAYVGSCSACHLHVSTMFISAMLLLCHAALQKQKVTKQDGQAMQ